MKKIYLLSQTKNNDYDTFDSCVVCADSDEAARNIYPDSIMRWTWCNPKYVNVKYIGIADDNVELNSIICSSFNAG